MLAPVTEVRYNEEELLRLNLASHHMFPRFVAELESDADLPVGYRACGMLLVARDNDDNAALADVLAFQQRLGLDVRRLRGSEARSLEPGLVSSIRGGIVVEGDHQIDNRALVEALMAACRGRGVAFETRSVAGIERAGNAVSGIELGDGRSIATKAIVLAAGARTPEIRGVPALPIRPVKGQLLHLRSRDASPVLTRNVRGLDVYMVPRPDGRLVVGATVEEQGFDERVTAGAVHDLLNAAYELVPEIAELELVETAVGHRPGTPDNAPLIGPLVHDGLLVATGHYRNGILLAPITADIIVTLLSGSTASWDIERFAPARFVALENAS